MDEDTNKAQVEKPQGNSETPSSENVNKIPLKPHPLITNRTGKGEPMGFILTGQGTHVEEDKQSGANEDSEISGDQEGESKPSNEHPRITNATGRGAKKWFILSGQSIPPKKKEPD